MNDNPDRIRRREDQCDRFEAAWKQGPRPRPEDYLIKVPEPERPELLTALIKVDQDYR